jgi:hypothetical protein
MEYSEGIILVSRRYAAPTWRSVFSWSAFGSIDGFDVITEVHKERLSLRSPFQEAFNPAYGPI